MKHAACAVLLAFAAAGATISPTHAGSGIPDIVRHAASFNSTSLSGIIVEQRHVALQAAAGPMHYAEENDAIVLIQDGQYKHVRYLRMDKNGATASNEEVAQRERQNNDDLARGKGFFKQPYDARYLGDYSYTETQCACATHARSIQFRSIVRDDQHGDGTMTIDPATGRVLSLTYTPDVMPPHASSGTVTETFGEAVPGVWTIISIDHSYTGRVAFFHGSGTLAERHDHFQRFDNRVAAMEFLQRVSI